MKKMYMIIDLQYGSTGKGLIAGYLAENWKPDTAIAAFGPNAGHTYVNDAGEFMHKMLPMGVFSEKIMDVLIGPGAVLDLDVLRKEIAQFREAYPDRKFNIWIHPNTPILQQRHLETEAEFVRIGSTMKGTAACAIEKMHRDPQLKIIASQWLGGMGFWFNEAGIDVYVATHREWYEIMHESKRIHIEGAQGWSLSIHGPFFPHCTSRDISTYQVLADCGIPADLGLPYVIGTARTYPIRVANRFDKDGKQIGYSGDCYFDQEEISWKDLGMEPELTTVTKLPRRIFTFSEQQVRDAVQQNGVKSIFLNFCNYLGHELSTKLIEAIEFNNCISVNWTGWGPHKDNVKEERG